MYFQSQVYKAWAYLLRLILSLTVAPSLLATNDHDPGPERYAALECQNEKNFAIVNFYPGRIFKISWGEDDQLVQADLPVHQSIKSGIESYKNNEVLLTIPVMKDSDPETSRIGMLYTTHEGKLRFMRLRCLLHGAD